MKFLVLFYSAVSLASSKHKDKCHKDARRIREAIEEGDEKNNLVCDYTVDLQKSCAPECKKWWDSVFSPNATNRPYVKHCDELIDEEYKKYVDSCKIVAPTSETVVTSTTTSRASTLPLTTRKTTSTVPKTTAVASTTKIIAPTSETVVTSTTTSRASTLPLTTRKTTSTVPKTTAVASTTTPMFSTISDDTFTTASNGCLYGSQTVMITLAISALIA